MTDERWRAAWSVYESACKFPPGQRRAFVESELNDPELRFKVMALLERQGSRTSEPGIERNPPTPDPVSEPSGLTGSEVDGWPYLGKKIGRFEVISPIGRGGMGDVYAARDLELNRTVALKFVSPGSIGTPAVERFVREAQSASALNHPGIVTVHEVIRFESSSAIVMEMVEGKSFRALCDRPNTPERVCDWGRQMSQALAVAHAHQIVHLDIKPDNLILRNDNLVKVLDFGIAKNITDESALDSVPLGTLGYMAPEQIARGEVTSAADVFSLGIILFELATGTHPFLAKTASETTRAIALLDPGPMRISHASRVGQRDLDALVRWMLAKDPSRRPGAAIVAAKLDQIARRLEGRRYARVWRFAIPALLASLATAWVLSSHWRDSSSFRNHPPQITQFTALEGREMQAAFSPDGRKIAFLWDGPDEKNRGIYVQEIDSKTPIRLTTNADEDSNPVWSPDGNEIAFLRRARGESSHAVMIMDANGGSQRRVGRILELEYFHGTLAWWPDGKSLVVHDESSATRGFVRLTLGTGAKLALSAPSGSRGGDTDVSTSPDGRRIAFIRRKGGAMLDDICLQVLASREQQCFPTEAHLTNLVWWHDGKEMLYATPDAIWRVTADQSIIRDRTKVLNGSYDDLAADRTGHRLVASRGSVDMNLWRVGRNGEGRVKLIASTKEESDAEYSPDGSQIVFRSTRLGYYDLWVADKNGLNPRRITQFSGEMGSARWSPDGKNIAFDGVGSPYERVKHSNIFVVSATGGPIRLLTDDKTFYYVPNWSRDGHWIYCVKQIGTHWETWKVPFEGGQQVQVSSTEMDDIVESSDGNLYYTTQRGAPGIWRRSKAGGTESLVPGTGKVGKYRYWQLAPMGIYFVEGPGNPVVQFVDLKTGLVTLLASLESRLSKEPRGLAVSPDGSSFLYVQEDEPQSDLILIDGIQ